MTQYVRVIKKSRFGRSVGTILEIKDYRENVIVYDYNDKFQRLYFKGEVEFIPEEISNSTLFKLMLDEQDLE